jgi:flagellar biosynthesis/type III secretory pathway ATPase
VLARFQENEDAIHYGMYVRGSDFLIDECIEKEPEITRFLRQEREERSTLDSSKDGLLSLF